MPFTVSLWSSSDFWEIVEYLSEGVVIVAALLEYLTEFEHLLKGEANKDARHRLGKRAAAALIIGLAFELGALVRTNQLFSNTIAGLEVEAKTANERAITASDNATRAFNRAAKAEGEAAKANEHAAVLNKQAEDEALARVQLQESIAWRRLSEGNRAQFGLSLSRFSGQATAFWFSQGDKEAETFANDIAVALHDSGKWVIYAPASLIVGIESGHLLGTTTPTETGVTIASTRSGLGRMASDALAEELNRLGFDAKVRPGDKMLVIDVFVNVRPEGPQGQAKLRAQKKNAANRR